MTADAGLQEIMGRYAPPGPGLGVSVDADLAVQIGGLVTELRADRKRRADFEQKMQQAIRVVPLPAVQAAAGTPAVFAHPEWVCKTGYVWAVQRVTAKGLGATDTVWVYRTNASAGAAALDSAAAALLTNSAPWWNPSRTGLVLQPDDGITVQGTTTAAVTVSIDVIIMEAWVVPDFLL